MGERYWTNDIIDPDEVATFGADCKGGANAFNSYWCDSTANKLVDQARLELDPREAAGPCTARSSRSSTTSHRSSSRTTARTGTGSASWVKGFHVTPLGNYDLSLETLTVGQH